MTRREFIRVVTQGALALGSLTGLGVLVRFLSYQPEPPPPRQFEVGLKTEFPPQSRTVLPNIPAILIRSEDSFHALSLVCTHLGCTVQEQAGKLVCPCHGSCFDSQGNVTRRPAVSPLQSLEVEVSPDGKIIISV